MNSTKTTEIRQSIQSSQRSRKTNRPYIHNGSVDRPFRNGTNEINTPIKKSYRDIKYESDNLYRREMDHYLREIDHPDAISKEEIIKLRYHYIRKNPVYQRKEDQTLNFGNFMRNLNNKDL